jgi:TolB-like protein/Tfp pilus assembly protein PilF
MAHDVFISYSSADKASADTVCSILEQNGTPCWIAPRDITPGVPFAEAIINAIKESKVFILIYTQNSNISPQVVKEVDRAVHHGLSIITLRLEDIPMSSQLEYYISDVHWLNAMTPPLEQNINRLSKVVKVLLSKGKVRDDEIEKAVGKGTLRLGKDKNSLSAAGKNQMKKRATAVAIIGLLLIAIIIILSVGLKNNFPRILTSAAKSIAVLPFSNLSNDPEQEYFSDGMMDEILDRLFKIGGLKVISRTSSMRYKNSNMSIKEIARELGVASILEGSVRRSGDNVRITVQLIDARSDAHLWSEIYDRDISDIFSIQSEVAQNIAKELKTIIKPEEKSVIEKIPTSSIEAYDAYLKGMFYWRKLTANDFDNAMKYFDLALEKDPGYARAYAGRAGVWGGLQQMGYRKAMEVRSDWKENALKAVEFDESSSEAHFALAGFLTWSEWDWNAAMHEWKRSLELNPNNADCLVYYSHFLSIIGLLDEALPPIEKALEADPFNALYHSLYAAVLNYHCRYEEAIAEAQKALALQPDAPIARGHWFLALEGLGRKEEHLIFLQERLARDPERLAAFQKGLASGGYENAFRCDADLLAARYDQNPDNSSTMSIAGLYRTAGDVERAVDWLEKAYDERNGNLPYIGRPINKVLHNSQRFRDLCKKLNIPFQSECP